MRPMSGGPPCPCCVPVEGCRWLGWTGQGERQLLELLCYSGALGLRIHLKCLVLTFMQNGERSQVPAFIELTFLQGKGTAKSR